MKKMTRRLALASFALFGALLGGAGQARAEFLAALGSTTASSNVIYTFDSLSSSSVTGVTVNGLAAGVSILSIDYRPANGALYGLGSNGGIYTINTNTGAATLASTLSGTSLAGGQISIDFNPTVDRLRIVSTSGQNLRVNVDTGVAVVDSPLSVNNVVAASYTNSFAGATSTTLYDLTYSNSVFSLNTQNPPNNGTVNLVGSTRITSPSSLVGFDISGTSGIAYVAANSSTSISANAAGLFTIDLTTGNVNSFAPIDGIGFQVRGLSVLPTAVPEPASLAMLSAGLVGIGLVAARRRRTASAR